MPCFDNGVEIVLDVPLRMAIGTAEAFARGYQYEYTFDTGMNLFVCSKPTQHGLSNEVLVIKQCRIEGVSYYVAQEGEVINNAFQMRQMVFRTQSQFWEAGLHSWEVNSVSCNSVACPPADWDLASPLDAETKHALILDV
jgi:hypothetical protein